MSARASSNVHAIVGPDSFLAEQALESLLQGWLGSDREGTVRVLRGDETSWARLVDNLGMGSLFAQRRAVVVRGADVLKGDGEEISGYLADETRGVSLILLASRPDRRRSVWKRILERANVVTAEPPRGRALRAFVAQRLAERKLRLGEEALEELIAHVGQDLRRLMGEVDKLEASFGGARALSVEDVTAVMGRGLAQPLYRLGDALAQRRLEDALALMQSQLEEGEAALRILATLHRSLRQLRGVLALRERRASREEMIRRLEILPFKMGDVLEASRGWSDAELGRAIAALGRADREMKMGARPEVALAAAVAEACLRRARPAGAAGPARLARRPGR